MIDLTPDEKVTLGQDICDAWEEDNEDRQQWLEDLPKWLHAYQGRPVEKDLPWPGASNLFVPVTGTVVDALHPRQFAAVARPDPVAALVPLGPEGDALARRQERVLD